MITKGNAWSLHSDSQDNNWPVQRQIALPGVDSGGEERGIREESKRLQNNVAVDKDAKSQITLVGTDRHFVSQSSLSLTTNNRKGANIHDHGQSTEERMSNRFLSSSPLSKTREKEICERLFCLELLNRSNKEWSLDQVKWGKKTDS